VVAVLGSWPSDLWWCLVRRWVEMECQFLRGVFSLYTGEGKFCSDNKLIDPSTQLRGKGNQTTTLLLLLSSSGPRDKR
jgi:hypothetical protein